MTLKPEWYFNGLTPPPAGAAASDLLSCTSPSENMPSYSKVPGSFRPFCAKQASLLVLQFHRVHLVETAESLRHSCSRNLPDKEFRFYRMVIVTCRLLGLKFTFPAPTKAVPHNFSTGRASVRIHRYGFARTCVFDKQSLLLFSCIYNPTPRTAGSKSQVSLISCRGNFAEFLNHDSSKTPRYTLP